MDLINTGSLIELEPFHLIIDVDYPGVLTTFVYPAGVIFDSYTSNIGTYAAGTWTIPTYVKDFDAVLTITVEVTDVALFYAGTRTVTGDTTDLTGEIQLVDNIATRYISGITCLDIQECSTAVYEEFDSMAEAVVALGEGKPFLYSLANIEGATYRGLHVTPFS